MSNAALDDFLAEVEEYLDGQADADLRGDRYKPNKAMSLMVEARGWRETLKRRPTEAEGPVVLATQRSDEAVILDSWISAVHELASELGRKNEPAGAYYDWQYIKNYATRYRWLRKNCQYGFEDHDGPQLVHRNGETGACQNARWREDLDTAIDEAMRQSAPDQR